MRQLKNRNIYQYYEIPEGKALGKKVFKPVPTGVYVTLHSIKDGVAKARVYHIKEQPKGKKLFLHEWTYVPEGQLRIPDVYPKYNAKPIAWKRLVQSSPVEAAFHILEEVNPKLLSDLQGAIAETEQIEIIAAAGNVHHRDLRVGQIWAKKFEDKDVLTLEKKFGQAFIVKNKFGDRSKVDSEDLAVQLNEGKYQLTNKMDIKSIIKAVGVLLAPFMGALMLTVVLGMLGKYLKKL